MSKSRQPLVGVAMLSLCLLVCASVDAMVIHYDHTAAPLEVSQGYTYNAWTETLMPIEFEPGQAWSQAAFVVAGRRHNYNSSYGSYPIWDAMITTRSVPVVPVSPTIRRAQSNSSVVSAKPTVSHRGFRAFRPVNKGVLRSRNRPAKPNHVTR